MSTTAGSIPHCRSFWFDSSQSVLAKSVENRHFDVVVIGGGFAGLSSALALKQKNPHWKIAIFETRHIGYGASGRSAGWLVNFPPLPWLLRDLNPQTVGDLSFFLGQIQNYIDDVYHEFTTDSQLIHSPSKLEEHYLISCNALEHATAKWMRTQLLKIGISCREIPFNKSSRLVAYNYRGAITWPVYMINPFELLQFHKRKAQSLQIEIFEGTSISSLDENKNIRTLKTSQGETITSHFVVVATNGYRDFLQPLGYGPTKYWTHSYMIATEPLDHLLQEKIVRNQVPFGDARLNYFCGRFYQNRLLFNGCDRKSNGQENQDNHTASYLKLTRELKKRFPDLQNTHIDAFWGGPIYETSSTASAICALNPGSKIFINWGHGAGSGIAMSLFSGQLVSHLIDPRQEKSVQSERMMDVLKKYRWSLAGIATNAYRILGNLFQYDPN